MARPGERLGGSVIRYQGWWEESVGPISRWESPTGGVSIIVSFGPTLLVDGSPFRSFVTGMYDRPALTEHDGVGFGAQVDLTSAGARSLLGTPNQNGIVALEDVPGVEVDRIVNRMLSVSSNAARFAVLDQELGPLLRDGPGMSEEVAWVERRLRHQPNTRVGLLAAELGWSRARLVERFRREVGLPPKTLARILRFQQAARRVAEGVSLADVAAESGYSDQAHFTRDFHALSARTPREFQAS